MKRLRFAVICVAGLLTSCATFNHFDDRADSSPQIPASGYLVSVAGKGTLENNANLVRILAQRCTKPIHLKVAAVLAENRWPKNLNILQEQTLKGLDPQQQIQALSPFMDVHQPPNWSSQTNAAVTYALGDLGAPAVPFVRKTLDDANPRRREAAAAVASQFAFKHQGQVDKPGARELIGRLAQMATNDPSAGARTEALRALASYGAPARSATPQIVAALDDPAKAVRTMAIDALGECGGVDAWPAVPKLVRMLRSEQYGDDSIYKALAVIGRGAAPAVPALIDKLDQEDEGFSNIDGVFWGIGLKNIDPSVVPAIIAKLPYIKSQCALQLIAMYGKPDPHAARMAMIMLEQAEYWNVEALADAIARLGRDDPTCLQLLRDKLDSDRPETRIGAADAYYQLTGDAKSMLKALAPLIENPTSNPRESERRCAAVAALARMGEAAKPIVPYLLKYLPSADPYDRAIYAEALFKITGDAGPALPLLQKDLTDKQDAWIQDTVEALGTMGPAPKPLVDTLVGQLSLRGPWSASKRFEAALALRQIGPTPATLKHVKTIKQAMIDEHDPWTLRMLIETYYAVSGDGNYAGQFGLLRWNQMRVRDIHLFMDAMAIWGEDTIRNLPRLSSVARNDPAPAVRRQAQQTIDLIRQAYERELEPLNDAARHLRWQRWANDFGDEDDRIAVRAIWRFVHVGADAQAFVQSVIDDPAESLPPDVRTRRRLRAAQALSLIQQHYRPPE